MTLRDPDRSRPRRARPSPSPSPSPSPTPVAAPAPAPADRLERARSLQLDPTAVSDLGLTDEVALLRAAIHRLAHDDEVAAHVKTLAELRHQVDTLCTALKTQHALEGGDEEALSATLARALEELGDELGVPR